MKIPSPNISRGSIEQILALLHDPLYVEFELEQEAPSIFNAVGRTHTETWHSALLGWLIDPQGSHGLGTFPLMRLLILLKSQEILPVAERGLDINKLIAVGGLDKARVRPNELELTEVTVGNMRFDVLVDQIKLEGWDDVQLLIEVKVKAKIDVAQNQKYIEYITQQRERDKPNKNYILPVYVAPTQKLIGTSQQILGHETWLALDYQSLNDEIIEPCLQHPTISQFGQFTLTEYVKTLKYRQLGGVTLATTQKDRDIVAALMDKHEPAIRALYEILSQSKEEFQPIISAGTTQSIKIKISNTKKGDVMIDEPSVPKLYENVLKLLYEGGYLQQLELPIPTSPKRYLISRNDKHQGGNKFYKAVKYKGYFMEANKNRVGALRDLSKLLQLCGLTLMPGD